MSGDPAWEAKRAELLRQIERVRPDTEAYADVRPATAAGLERTPQHGRVSTPAERMPFGRFLLSQRGRPETDWIGTLARAAAADRGFPVDGDPEAIRARLRALHADGDMFEAVDDAELNWLSF